MTLLYREVEQVSLLKRVLLGAKQRLPDMKLMLQFYPLQLTLALLVEITKPAARGPGVTLSRVLCLVPQKLSRVLESKCP